MHIIIISLAITLFLLACLLFYIVQDKKIKAKREAWEQKIYKQVVYDLEQGNKRPGLWRLAQNEANGLENVCESIYIKYCVESIIGEHEILGTVKY